MARGRIVCTARMFAIETGCPPPELLVTVSMTSGIFSRALGLDQPFERRDVHVAFERNARLRVGGFGQRQIDGARAGELDVGARGVEVRVAGHDVAGPAHHGEQNALRRAALVRGDHVREAGELVDHFFEPEKTFAARVRFVAAHHGRPLRGGHRAGAGIGQQVDQNIGRAQLEKIVAGLFEKLLALLRRGVAQRLDAADAERLDDGFHPTTIVAQHTHRERRRDQRIVFFHQIVGFAKLPSARCGGSSTGSSGIARVIAAA